MSVCVCWGLEPTAGLSDYGLPGQPGLRSHTGPKAKVNAHISLYFNPECSVRHDFLFESLHAAVSFILVFTSRAVCACVCVGVCVCVFVYE